MATGGLSPLVAGVLLLALGCGDRKSACPKCETVVISAVSTPVSLLPPLVQQTVERDVSDLIFERLADLEPGSAPIDTTAYRPRLAARWERVDSLTWRFHLRPGSRWQDGRPVRADDVVYSFGAYRDTTVGSPAAGNVEDLQVTAEDSVTVQIRFPSTPVEPLYHATIHVRIFPKHIWEAIPKTKWAEDTALANLVGSGPYRLRSWTRGQSLALEADSTVARQPAIKQVVWRFAPDPDAALNLILSHEADLMEAVGTPDRVERVEADPLYRTIAYPSAAYGFLSYRLAASGGQRNPILADRRVRRALGMAVDRAEIARAVLGPETKAPPGPMSQVLWIWSDDIATLPFDTSAAAALLDEAGWRPSSRGTRSRAGALLTVDILVPSTSTVRIKLAELLQAKWRALGVSATVTAVDFPVFQERLGRGRFDSYIGTYLDEPSPRGLADQWTKGGWGKLNYGRYASPAFDSIFTLAARETNVAQARGKWREAMDTLNADAPGIFLFAPTNVAAVARRLEGVKIDPYSWLSGLPEWKVVSANSGQ